VLWEVGGESPAVGRSYGCSACWDSATVGLFSDCLQYVPAIYSSRPPLGLVHLPTNVAPRKPVADKEIHGPVR